MTRPDASANQRGSRPLPEDGPGDDPGPVGSARPDARRKAAGKPLDSSPRKKEANRLAGLKRAASLTPERRSEIARRAALARWAKRPESREPTPAPEPGGEEAGR